MGQDQQQQPLTESMNMFSFENPSDPSHQYLQFDNSQFYPPQMLESEVQQQHIDPSQFMVSAPVTSQYASNNASPATPAVDSTSSYTPPPGAARAGARRVAGSWRPPPQFLVPTPAGTPQYLSPAPSAPWSGLSTN
ncbi:hypothetical protein QCA50_004497 [Cerrena zonata]|uniref:Uncharacterized protein n=1 Tax=Cerrena zonata TaxID=2478898 RepID=A0AAW0GSF7_9APHY